MTRTAAPQSPAGRTPVDDAGPALSFPEWAETPQSAPVRQGDVLSSLTDTSAIWRQLLVVITADCDLAREKHEGALTCLPILHLRDYLLSFRYDKIRTRLMERAVLKLLDEIADTSTATTLRISPARMQEWLAEESIETIVSELGEDLRPSDTTQKLMASAQNLITESPSTIKTAVQLIADLKVALGDIASTEKAHASTSKEFASTLQSLPGDAMMINELSSVHSDGYAVYLRRAIEVPEASVTASYARLPHNAEYVRVSRLRPPYVYALTQQFAAVFSAIGLPAEYEDARESIAERIRSGDY